MDQIAEKTQWQIIRKPVTWGGLVIIGILLVWIFGPEERRALRVQNDRLKVSEVIVGEFDDFILNETAVNSLGYGNPTDALGQIIHFPTENSDMEIIGVIPDINLRSSRTEVRPFVYYVDDSNLESMSIKFEQGQSQQLLSNLQSVWNDLVPGIALQHGFLVDNIARLYREKEQQGLLLSGFSVLSVFLSSLSLYGLASYSAERITREFGVRKVLGASFIEIIRHAVWQFSRPVLIAGLIAMNQSLNLVLSPKNKDKS